jgi:hypothetical protein
MGVHQEFAQVATHVFHLRRIRGAQVNQQVTDLAWLFAHGGSLGQCGSETQVQWFQRSRVYLVNFCAIR